MPKLKSLLAAALCLALAVEPVLAAGIEVPGGGFESAPRSTPVAPVPGNLAPLPGNIDLPAPIQLPALTETGLPAPALPSQISAAGQTASAPASSVMPTFEVAKAAAASVSQRASANAQKPLSASGKAEFSGLGGRKDGELSERVWEHAESRGFEREAHVSAWENEGGASAPLEPTAGEHQASSKPTPPSPEKKEALSVRSAPVIGFLLNFLLLQLAVESLALAVPQMTDPLKNGFIALGALASTSYLAYSTGSFIGGRLVHRLGLANVYRTIFAIRTALWAAVAYIFHTHGGTISPATLIAFFSGDYLVHSIGRVAERTLQREWFKGSPVASNRFGTWRDFIEYGTVFTTMGTGLIIAAFGFGAIIYTAPVLFALAGTVAFLLRSLPNKASESDHRPLSEGFKDLFGPNLRTIFLTRLLINNFVYLLYYVTATAFGVFVAHGNPGQAAAAASVLIGLLGMGANAAAVGNSIVSSRIEKKTANLPEGERAAAQTNLMTQGVAKALKWAALAMLGGWFFVSKTQFGTVGPYLIALAPFAAAAGFAGTLVVAAKAARAGKFFTKETAFNAAKFAGIGLLGLGALLLKAHVASVLIWPVFALSPVLILIGLTGQMALTQLDTLMSEKMPEHNKAYVVGADRTVTNLSYAFNFMLWAVLFQVFGTAAFYGLGVYCTLTAAAYLLLSRRLRSPKK